MKTLYVCDFCGNTSADRAAIEECEARGAPGADQAPPIGLIYGSHNGDSPHSMYPGFAWLVDCVRPHRHSLQVSAAVFRSNMPVDDEPDFANGSRDGYSIGGREKPWQEWPDAPLPGPVLERAIAACRKAGVEPLVLRGGKAQAAGE